MKRTVRIRISIALAALLAGVAPTALDAAAQTTPAIQGMWRSSDTTMRVVVTKGEVRGIFATVGKVARELGFKPDEVSFTAVPVDNYLHGVQTIRYTNVACHPKGRRVTMMARITPNGRTMAIHTYAIRLDDLCRDSGQFSIAEALWQRVP